MHVYLKQCSNAIIAFEDLAAWHWRRLRRAYLLEETRKQKEEQDIKKIGERKEVQKAYINFLKRFLWREKKTCSVSWFRPLDLPNHCREECCLISWRVPEWRLWYLLELLQTGTVPVSLCVVRAELGAEWLGYQPGGTKHTYPHLGALGCTLKSFETTNLEISWYLREREYLFMVTF